MGVKQTYAERNQTRCQRLDLATMSFVEYFINLGDDLKTSEQKVSEMSTELAPFLYAYTLGNITPTINLINSSTLTFMTTEAKEFLISKLTVN